MTGIPILPVVTVTISGEIDIATSRAMRDALATGTGPAHLEVNMSAVTFMDASGIGVLLAARQRVVDGGGSLTLRAPSRAVRRLTGVLGLDELLITRLSPAHASPSPERCVRGTMTRRSRACSVRLLPRVTWSHE